jgi:hypothetical protein
MLPAGERVGSDCLVFSQRGRLMMPFVSTIARCAYSHHIGDTLSADKFCNRDFSQRILTCGCLSVLIASRSNEVAVT